MLLEPMERSDIRVIHLREEFRLSLETFQAFLVSRELLGKNFDGNVAFELRVPRPVDFSHAARTDRLDDFVMRELGSGKEGHGSG